MTATRDLLASASARGRSAGPLLAFAALGFLSLTACGGVEPTAPVAVPELAPSSVPVQGEARPFAPAAGEETTAPGPGAGAETAATAQSPAARGTGASFAGTEQFVQIKHAWTREGRTYVSVRPARKKLDTQFEAWVITPGDGPWTTVPLTEGAQCLLTVQVRGDDGSGAPRGEAVPYSQAGFVTKQNQLKPEVRERVGFDLSFDGKGRVTRLQSLYTP